MVCFILIRGVPLVQLLAVPVPYTWTFPSATGYTLSDTDLIEVGSNTTRLKVQNYASDANTGMLLHLDESSGNPTDSAGTPNTATASNVTYSTGKLNNGAVFNGSTSKISVADTSGISLNNSHTIETWANLDSAFSANSGYTRQPIFDKGSHQMYFDKDTGELVYEVALANQTTWSHVAGPVSSDTPGSDLENPDGTVTDTWDYNGKAVVSAITHIGSDLYVGLGAELADAEVWKFNGTIWSKIGGDKLRTSWDNEKYEMVSAMATNGTTLYVGLGTGTNLNNGDAEVWSLDTTSDGNNWVQIGGDGLNTSWNYVVTTQGPFEIVNSLVYAGGALYAGLGSTAAANNTDAEVWRYNGSSWTKVGGDSNQSGYGWSTTALYENVLSMTSDGTNLYVGMSVTAGDADVWTATLASLATTPAWSQIGGDGTGWTAAQFEEVRALYAQGGYVYVGLGTTVGDAEVYRYTTATTTWTKIGECPSTSSCTTQGWANNVYEQIWSIWGDGTYTYYSMGNSVGDNDVWRFADAGTEDTADDTWLQIAGSAGATDIGNNHTNARVLYHDGTSLYTGLQYANAFTGEVWKYNGSQYNWTLIGGNYTNDSWGYYPISRVESMVTGNGKLYVGMGATASGKYGSAIVWQHDGTTWTRIGGMGKNSSWNGTFSPVVAYETINSMIMYNGHLYVGLGASATDAEVWGWEVVTPNTWTKVGGDGGVPVAVASSGTGNRAASSNNDGVTSWTARTSAADTSWSGVVYGNDTYVAVSSSGVTQSVMTSPDGTTWTIRNAASDNAWQSVTFGEGLFVAVSSSGTNNRVMTSPNGIDWLSRTSAADNNWKSVTYGNGMFVAIANSGTNNRVMTSPNGIDWTIQTSAADLSWNSVTYGNGLFVAVANDGVLGSVMISTNGTSWTQQNAATTNAWQGVAFGRGVFAAVSSTGTSNRAMTSTDGITWTSKTTPVNGNSYNWSSITFNNSYNNTGRFIATANGGALSTQRIMYGQLSTTTTDTTWALVNFSSTNAWNAITNNTSWSAAVNIETVQSMTVHECPGVTTMCMYVGLGISANDSKVYAYDGSSWQQVGGYGTVGSWEGLAIEAVNSLVSYNGKLYAALGNTAPAANNGDAELWEYAGTGTTWTKVAGDGVNSSWNYSGATAYGPYEAIYTTAIYNGDLYVGLGFSADSSVFADAEVWKWSGSGNWTKVGGDGENGSWDFGQTYESVRSMAVYNGELYVGLGDTAATNYVDSEVWKWNGSTWTIVGGEAANNSSWPDTVTPLKEQVYSLVNYRGKLYAGLGNGVGDAAIWAYGGNAVARTTTTTTQPTGWRHIAATYDQSAGSNQLKIYIDGVEKATATATSAIIDNSFPLLIGTEYGNRFAGEKTGYLDGSLDEIRFSNNVRTSFNLTPYTDDIQTIRPSSPHFTSGVKEWASFDAVETIAGQGILYRLSIDGGTTWKYWNTGSSAWVTSTINFDTDDEATIISRMNDKTTINSHITALTAGSGGIVWQAALNGDGSQATTLTSVTVSAEPDEDPPTNPTSITALSAASGGVPISASTWYPHAHPYFSWSGEDDGAGSGVAGYFVVFDLAESGVCNGDPEVDGMPQASPTYTVGTITAGETYCLLIKTYDYAGNVSGTLNAFTYQFDSVNDAIPDINPIPGFINDTSLTFSWQELTDVDGAPLQKLQYKTGAGDVTSTDPRGDTYADWQDLLPNATSVTIGGTATEDKASYQDGSNVFYLRTVDVAGNEGTPGTEVYNSSGEGPSEPQGLTAFPATTAQSPATSCNFTYQWDPPEDYYTSGPSGDNPNLLTYCFRVNGEPNESYCTGKWSLPGVTSTAGCLDATINGTNIFYVVARNSAEGNSTVNYAANTGINFYLDTEEPGPPRDVVVADISEKASSDWKLTVTWLKPAINEEVVHKYKVYRSLTGEEDSFEEIGQTVIPEGSDTGGRVYADMGLDQETYYYRVAACDEVNTCSTLSDIVEMYPTGKFTEAAGLVSGPIASDITTKKATVAWGTDRASDSKIQYGTSSGSYFTEEPSNSSQVTAHEITLNNLSPGTTYHYKAKWTDEDGNTGASAEKTFTTEPAPTIKDVAAVRVGIDSAFVTFTVTGGTRVKLYYGDTAAFGLVKTVSVGTAETTESVELDTLEDDTKYYYKVNGVDSDGVEYDGTTLSFTTLPRPKVTNAKVQQIVGTAQPAILVTWNSNTPISSIATYYPTSNPSSVQDEVSVELTSGVHQMILRGLYPDTSYSLVVSGRDKAGNEARSDKLNFTTATDTRPPRVTNLKIESSSAKAAGSADEQLAQLIVSWTTDEPATSQVEYGEGAGVSYPQKTQEDATYKVNHLVIISNLPPSRVYHIRALSNDSAANIGKSQDTVTITPKGGDDALDLVSRNLIESFGFLRGIMQR